MFMFLLLISFSICLILLGGFVFVIAIEIQGDDAGLFRVSLMACAVLLGLGGFLLLYTDCTKSERNQTAHDEYIKNLIAEEYPDAIDFKSKSFYNDDNDIIGSFESDGVKYKIKETEDLKGNKVLSIVGTDEKNPDTKIIKMDESKY